MDEIPRWIELSGHSPGPAEDKGVLDGHQRSQLGTLGVMVLATVLAPCDTHIRHVNAGHSHTL